MFSSRRPQEHPQFWGISYRGGGQELGNLATNGGGNIESATFQNYQLKPGIGILI